MGSVNPLNSMCLYIFLESIAFIMFSKMSVASKRLRIYQGHISEIETFVFLLLVSSLVYGTWGTCCSIRR